MIKSMQEVVCDQLNEALNAAMAKYGATIRPVYLVDRNGKPAHCGTCSGLEIEGERYLMTAAHVADDIVRSGRYASKRGTFMLPGTSGQMGSLK